MSRRADKWAWEFVTGDRKYVILRDYYSGRRKRFTVIRLDAKRPVYIGLEVTWAHAWRLCR